MLSSVCSAGLGMYESSVYLGAHEEESGGRSVPTTPLQIAAPGTNKTMHPNSQNYFKIILEKCRIMQWALVQFHLLRIQMPLQNGRERETHRDDKLFQNSFNIPFYT